jgi:hypothetical protein
MLKNTILRITGLFGLLGLTVLVANAQLWQTEDPKFPGANRLLRRYKAIQPDLAGATSAATKDGLLIQLAELRKDILAEEASNAGSEELRSRLRFFREAVDKDLRRLQEPSPAPLAQPSSNPDPWDSVGYRAEVEAYRNAEEELRTHLCLEPTEGTPRERAVWKSQRDSLLLTMIMAEERLVFAASGSFTREDADKIASIFGKQEEIRRLLIEAMRVDRQAAEIRQILANFEGVMGTIKPDEATGSKPSGMGLVILLLGWSNAEYHLNRAETISGQTKMRIVSLLREVTNTAVSVYADMRTRGIGTINRRLGVGQRSFRVHRPIEPAQKAELERLLLNFVNRQMGVNLPIVRGTGSFPENQGITYVLFDQAEQKRFVNNQCRERTIAALRLEKTTFAPGEDVNVAFVTPIDLRGKTWVGIMLAAEPHRPVKYINSEIDISQFQPLSPENRADGELFYRAPQASGRYEIRMFEKETGREVTTVRFEVAAQVADVPARCSISGEWSQSRANGHTSIWIVANDGTARESGLRDAKGMAAINGDTLSLRWTANDGFAGTYVIQLDNTCDRGKGTMSHTRTPAGVAANTVLSTFTRKPSGLTGKWRMIKVIPAGQPYPGSYSFEIDLVERDGVVTGSGYSVAGRSTFSGTLRNGEVVFNRLDVNGFRAVFRGRLNGSTMTGIGKNDVTSPQGNSAAYTWTATRL